MWNQIEAKHFPGSKKVQTSLKRNEAIYTRSISATHQRLERQWCTFLAALAALFTYIHMGRAD